MEGGVRGEGGLSSGIMTHAHAAAVLGADGTTGLWDSIAGMDSRDLVRRYRYSVGHFDDRVFELSEEQLDTAFAPEAGVGRWPVRVLLGHLADAELVNAHRIRRAVAEPGAVLGLWDENAFIDAGLYHSPGGGGASLNGAPAPIGAFVGAIWTMRQWVGEWLGKLEAGAWHRTVMHPERGELSVRDLVVGNVWHLENHAYWLNLKAERFLGPRPSGCGPTGCGASGCACKPGAAEGAGG